MEEEKAVAYLSKDPLLHVDMLESIRRGEAKLMWVSDRGVLLRNTACGVVMMSAEEEEADRMLAALDGAPALVAHQAFYIQKAQEKFGLQTKRFCRQAVYPGRMPLPPDPVAAGIRPLGGEHLPFLMAHYSQAEGEEDYLRERLSHGAVFGAFASGGLAGFIGIHSEGSMGMLEVLPEYRRRGIAAALGTFLVNRMLAQGRVPFSQILLGNGPSLALHRKFGFSVSSGTVCWLIGGGI